MKNQRQKRAQKKFLNGFFKEESATLTRDNIETFIHRNHILSVTYTVDHMRQNVSCYIAQVLRPAKRASRNWLRVRLRIPCGKTCKFVVALLNIHTKKMQIQEHPALLIA